MGDHNKGIDSLENISAEWFIVDQADCLDDNINTIDELFEESTDGSVISNLIDDDEVDQGNSLAFFNTQLTDECNRTILELKRKYHATPEKNIADLSPRLAAVSISPQRQIKKRLFQDSGILEDEAESNIESVQVDEQSEPCRDGNRDNGLEILQCSNAKAIILAKFKELFGASFTDLTRPFRSDKTCNDSWVLALYKVSDDVIESSKLILKKHCTYFQLLMYDIITLYLLDFKNAKSRETVHNLFISMFNINTLQIISAVSYTNLRAHET